VAYHVELLGVGASEDLDDDIEGLRIGNSPELRAEEVCVSRPIERSVLWVVELDSNSVVVVDGHCR
jgi:hypothetical protein